MFPRSWKNPDLPWIEDTEPPPVGPGMDLLVEELSRGFRSIPNDDEENDHEHSW